MNLEAFDRVKMETPSCRLVLSEGTEYAVDYQLSNAYEILTLGVEDGAFIFRCRHRYPTALFHWNSQTNYVFLTVPPGITLSSVCFKNTSGPVEISGIRTSQLEAHTVSGSIHLTDISAGLLLEKSIGGSHTVINCAAGEMEFSSVSGAVSCEQLSVTGSLRGQNTSGKIQLEGEVHGGMELKNTSGSLCGTGLFLGCVELKNVSGGIELNQNLLSEECSYALHTVSGGKRVNGQPADSIQRENAAASVTAQTVSGGIHLNFIK